MPVVATVTRDRTVDPVEEGYRLRTNPGSLYGLTMAGAQITCFGLLAVYLTQDIGMSPVTAGVVFGGVLGIAVVARIVWGWFSDRRSHNRSLPLQACAALGVLGFVALAVPALPFVALGVLLIGTGAAAWNGAYLAAVVSSTSVGEGAAVGWALLLVNIGCIGGPLLASLILATTHSWIVLWLAMALAQAVGLAAVTRATEVGVAPAQVRAA
jgi:MFS family permease